MQKTAFVLAGVLTALLVAGCSSGAGTAPTVSSPQSLSAHTPYHFWIVNHSDVVLQIINEPYYGECVSAQFPTTDIEPKSTLDFVIHTVTSGHCALKLKGGLVTLDYGNGLLYAEYFIDPHSHKWHVEGFGRGSIISFTGTAPITTTCSRDRNGNPACVVKTGTP